MSTATVESPSAGVESWRQESGDFRILDLHTNPSEDLATEEWFAYPSLYAQPPGFDLTSTKHFTRQKESLRNLLNAATLSEVEDFDLGSAYQTIDRISDLATEDELLPDALVTLLGRKRVHLWPDIDKTRLELPIDVEPTHHITPRLANSFAEDDDTSRRTRRIANQIRLKRARLSGPKPTTDITAELPRFYSTSAEHLKKVTFGSHSYPLRAAVEVETLLAPAGTWHFRVPEFRSNFVGAGRTPEEARRDFEAQVHAAFQKLVKKRPFQMSDSERELWALLATHINVEEYNRVTPVTTREAGRVRRIVSPGLIEVEWLNNRLEQIALETAPPEFATYEVGQSFEAPVERKPGIRGDLVRIGTPTLIDPIEALPAEEVQKFWNSMKILQPTSGLEAP
jgi:hypothetical protein